MIVLHIAEPQGAFLRNSPPDGVRIVAAQRQCAVTGEANHQDFLGGLEPGSYWATLHRTTVPTGKYAGEPTLEVQIDGVGVGTLTAIQGGRYSTVLGGDETVACEASVFEGNRYREVHLLLPRVD